MAALVIQSLMIKVVFFQYITLISKGNLEMWYRILFLLADVFTLTHIVTVNERLQCVCSSSIDKGRV